MQDVVATTPTQYAFAICLLIVAPVLAIFAADAQRSRGENAWNGALLVGGASCGGWIVSGVIAAVMFPGYPASGSPPEPVAMLFVLPGLLAGALALRWIITRKPAVRASRRRGRIILAATIGVASVLAVALVWAHIAMTTWPARRELPGDAEILEERAYTDTFLGDFEYVLRARMSEASFREWMRRLDVQNTADPTRYGVPHDYIEHECGSQGSYEAGIGTFHSWCS